MLRHERDPRHQRRAAEGPCLRGQAGDRAAHRPLRSGGGPKPALSDQGPSCLRRAQLPAPLWAPEPSGCAGQHAEMQPWERANRAAGAWRPSTRASPPYGSRTAARPDRAPRFGPNRSLRGSWRERGAGLTALPPPVQVPATQRSAAEAEHDASERLRAATRGSPRPPAPPSRYPAPCPARFPPRGPTHSAGCLPEPALCRARSGRTGAEMAALPSRLRRRPGPGCPASRLRSRAGRSETSPRTYLSSGRERSRGVGDGEGWSEPPRGFW